MIRNYYGYKVDHSTYGGEIYKSDFEYQSITDTANRIISERRTDNQYRKAAIARDNFKKNNMIKMVKEDC